MDNKCHREDGPAVEYANGNKLWFLFGKRINVTSVAGLKKALKLALIEQVQES